MSRGIRGRGLIPDEQRTCNLVVAVRRDLGLNMTGIYTYMPPGVRSLFILRARP
jgi:hypothetical protein